MPTEIVLLGQCHCLSSSVVSENAGAESRGVHFQQRYDESKRPTQPPPRSRRHRRSSSNPARKITPAKPSQSWDQTGALRWIGWDWFE